MEGGQGGPEWVSSVSRVRISMRAFQDLAAVVAFWLLIMALEEIGAATVVDSRGLGQVHACAHHAQGLLYTPQPTYIHPLYQLNHPGGLYQS